MASLRIEKLRYERSGFSLDLDLELADGEFGVLLGPSGCGKSTALRLVAGLLKEESGGIWLDGRDISGLPPEKRKVGLVFQDFALFGHMSARKNIEYGPKTSGAGRNERKGVADSLSESFHMQGFIERLPSTLSGGEQQRVALARSLAAKPDLLLLDEPLSSLDASLRKELRSDIRSRVKESGIGALHVTHDVEEALAMADRIFIMERGRIRESGRPEEVYLRPESAFAARLMGSGPLLPVLGMEEREGWRLARTAAGIFRCGRARGLQHGSGRVSQELKGKAKAFVHFPHEALHPRTEGSPETGNILAGRVISSSYLGRKRLILIEAMGSSRDEGLVLELELEAMFNPDAGSIIRLGIPCEDCSIVE